MFRFFAQLMSEGIPLEQGLRLDEITVTPREYKSEGIPLEQGLRR